MRRFTRNDRLILQEAARIKRKNLQENQQTTLLEELIEDIEVQLDGLQDDSSRLERPRAATAYEKGVNWGKISALTDLLDYLKAIKGDKIVSERTISLRESEGLRSQWTFHLSNPNPFQVKLTYSKLDGSHSSYVLADWESKEFDYDVAYELYLGVQQEVGSPIFHYEDIKEQLELL